MLGLLINHLFTRNTGEKGLISSIFTGLFSARFRRTIHVRFTEVS